MTSIMSRYVTRCITRNASVISSTLWSCTEPRQPKRTFSRVASTTNIHTVNIYARSYIPDAYVARCHTHSVVSMSTSASGVSEYVPTDVTIDDVVQGVLRHSLILIDVRRPDELLETGSIGTAANIPVDTIESAFSLSDQDFKEQYQVDKPSTESDNIVLFCRSGVRAMTACQTMYKLGYSRVKRYPGSMMEWEEKLLGSTAEQRRLRAPSA